MNSSFSFSLDVPCAARPHGSPALPPRSRATVDCYLGEDREVRRTSCRLFGRALETWEYAGLAGAPDDGAVLLATLAGSLYLELHQPLTHAYHGVWLVRWIRDACVVCAEGFRIHAQSMQRQGLGLRVLQVQSATASALGICRIEALAGRSEHENGYYTWPRLGFDGPLPEETLRRLPPQLHFAHDVLDLIEHNEGRRWWQQFGTSIQVEFNLAPHSRSWRVLQRYVEAKAVRSGPSGAVGERSG
jgi:hypothetical protein